MGLHKGQTNNPNGRPSGSKNEKTKQWEELHESIVGVHADRFNSILQQWADSFDPDEQAAFVSIQFFNNGRIVLIPMNKLPSWMPI